ncbi:hypothetical protein [Sphingomonas crusticola]|uniref:hypothetical protein n=1 Tax=Sphingomonas crusticola TaxID=1697973 RepID=UPI0013C33ABC|nr:hypothetical protein [Sphingomonas crusticola]
MTKRPVWILAAVLAVTAIWGGALSAAAPPGGTISIEPKTGDGEYDPSTPAFVSAATEALAARGFTILEDPGHSAYVVELILSREAVGTGTAKVATGKSAMMPGGVGGSVGAGITIPLSTGQSTLVPLQRTRLEMRIRKRGDAAVVWDGAAVTVRAVGSRRGADALVASDLSQAVLRSYPAQPADAVGVP